MDLSLSLQAIKNLFTFPFKDPQWKTKFLIGMGITLAGLIVPIIPWLIVLGYIARVIRAGAANEDAARLPEWDDWGDLLMDGLRQFGVTLIYMLPALIVFGIGWVLYMAGIISISGAEHDPSGSSGRAMFFVFSMLVLFISMGLGMLLTLAALLVMPVAQVHAAVNRRFGAAFQLSGWWRVLRANFSGFLVGMGVFLGMETLLGLASQFLYMTMVLCLFIPLLMFPASFYIMLVAYRIFGQAYGEGRQKLEGRLEGEPAVQPDLAAVEGI